MVWSALTEGFAEALKRAGLWSPERLARLELSIPRDTGHGDWTTNLALLLARETGRPPRAVAEALIAAFPRDPAQFAAIEVAGPGFINLRYADAFLSGLPARILAAGALDPEARRGFGCHDHARGEKILVEYVSANPTGPLNVVNARAAAVGSALVRLLNATGHAAAGEYYVNDAGTQVDLLGESVAARFAEHLGLARAFPENGYQGEYLRDLAGELDPPAARAALGRPDGAAWFRDRALERMLESQRRDLSGYGAEYARWFRESELHARGEVMRTLESLRERGMVYEAEGATWVRTSSFGDDKDRVVVRSNGAPTYLLPDIAYHRDKRARGFRYAIDLWGPDHHGHILPLQAALQALGLESGFLEVLIVQQVNLLSGGQPVRMSKRAGEFVTLGDLVEDIGADCAKFFFLMRSTNAHLDFDLDLARRQNDENPAYYVQYAHARIASILRYAAERGLEPSAAAGAEEPALADPAELLLARRLAAFPEVVRGAAFAREPHRLPAYLLDTAAIFHRFYHACRVVTEDQALSIARLRLAEATRLVLHNGLALMGVSAPQRMERAAEAAT
ncbi:MAG TPA: arginine--tRNA ligase [Candidatus Eisenbacteria bacterium]